MKKFLLSAALALGLSFSNVIAGVPGINAQVKEAFKSQFPTATEAEWSTGNDYYKVNFLYNKNYVTAFYTPEGSFLAAMRNISSLNLPMMLQTSLKNDYTGYWITDLYELAKYEGSSYYVTLENASQKIVLKSAGGSSWSLHKKTGKT